MKPANFFRIYAVAAEKLDRKWFGNASSEYKTDIGARLIPQLAIGVLIQVSILCGYGHGDLCRLLYWICGLSIIGIFLWNIVGAVRQDRADGLKRNSYLTEFVVVLLGCVVYQYVADAFGMLFLFNFLVDEVGYSFFAAIFDPSYLFIWAALPFLIVHICCFGIWIDFLYRHWGNLATTKDKFFYVLFSWVVMVAGTQLFGIAMVFGYMLYLIGWVLFWFLFILIFGSKGNRRSGSYTLDDGTQVKEQAGLFGDKSYRGSDGSDYTTSDGGETFTKR